MVSEKNDIKYRQAYAEISTILKLLPKSAYEKIPQKLISLMEENKLKEYESPIQSIDDLNKDDLLHETQIILLIIYNNYLASEEEKKIIEKNLIENEKKYLEEINEKYNPDNIFKQKEVVQKSTVQKDEKLEEKTGLPIEYHESIFNKFISFIKKIFSKRR